MTRFAVQNVLHMLVKRTLGKVIWLHKRYVGGEKLTNSAVFTPVKLNHKLSSRIDAQPGICSYIYIVNSVRMRLDKLYVLSLP